MACCLACPCSVVAMRVHSRAPSSSNARAVSVGFPPLVWCEVIGNSMERPNFSTKS